MFGLDDLLFLGLSAFYTKGEGRKEVEQQKHRGKADIRFFLSILVKRFRHGLFVIFFNEAFERSSPNDTPKRHTTNKLRKS